MFRVVIGLEAVGKPHKTFADAFRSFFEEIKKIIAKGTNVQVLETACYIEHTPSQSAMCLYECRELAYGIGLLRGEGELMETPSIELSEEVIQGIFILNMADEQSRVIRLILDDAIPG